MIQLENFGLLYTDLAR